MKMKKLLTLLLAVLLLAGCAGNKPGTFEAGKNTFLLNGKPFVVKAAEVHYPRIPREYWEHRIEMCKALGMNTLCLYVFWNLHEETPGKYDFTGNKDIAAFCKLAQKHGMYVIVRPGPYVCAEWEMGGLPWWLLKNDSVQLRTLDPFYMQHVGAFMHEVGKQLQDLQTVVVTSSWCRWKTNMVRMARTSPMCLPSVIRYVPQALLKCLCSNVTGVLIS